jgi:drug/metabolite transporter (DMT)-like permease
VAGAISGLASAALFGISAPMAKLLLPRVDPWVLAGLLYAGAGTGLVGFRIVQKLVGARNGQLRRRLQRRDTPLLLAIAIIGGGVGPVLMLVGLRHLSGVAGALLLNLEAVFTALLAVTFFGERLTGMESIAVAIVIAGAVLISASGGPFRAELRGALAIAAACLAWGLDNNLTARLSGRNPVDLVQFKALTAGAGNLVLALAAGRAIPGLMVIVVALAVGFVCYGISIVLDVYALRYVGAARESAFFATAPFSGAIAAVPLLGERVRLHEVGSGLVMGAGVALLIAARRQTEARS